MLFYILKFKFYHSTEGHIFSFWPCYTRYALLIIDKLPVEFFRLMPLLHLPLETTNRFQVLIEIVVNFTKKNIFHFISVQYGSIIFACGQSRKF